ITHGRSTGWNLFERNRFAFADGSAVGLRSSNNIFRFNSFYNNSLGGLQIVGMQGYTLPNDNLVYHNVFYLNGYGADYEPFSGAVYFADWNNVGPLHGNVFKNNIFFANKGGAFTYDSDVPERTSIIENNYEGDPKFVSDMSHEYFPFGPQPDFSLQAESPCIDAGGTLTNIISSTGTGTKFKVANPWYFYDGWTIPGEQGDLIQLEGETTSVRIQKIDYTTKEITVESPISWTENQGISLAFSGAAPDIGAYEYTITSCQTKAECPDIICKNKNCIGHECVYSDADENTLCRGDCMVCSGGRCMKNYDLLCGIGEVCSDGLCIDNPNCISTEEINAAIISWYTSGNITMNSLIDEIIKWKNHCSD
ncbi:MAG: hypothetical protein QXK37_06170, partial [Candidatus Woesearchaeota archaeon]